MYLNTSAFIVQYFNGKQRKEKKISFSIAKEYERHDVSSIGFAYVCVVVFLLISIFSFFRRLSTTFLVRHFMFLNVTYAKIIDRYEIFLIVYCATFSLEKLLNISCRLSCTNNSFQAKHFSHTPFSFLIK